MYQRKNCSPYFFNSFLLLPNFIKKFQCSKTPQIVLSPQNVPTSEKLQSLYIGFSDTAFWLYSSLTPPVKIAQWYEPASFGITSWASLMSFCSHKVLINSPISRRLLRVLWYRHRTTFKPKSFSHLMKIKNETLQSGFRWTFWADRISPEFCHLFYKTRKRTKIWAADGEDQEQTRISFELTITQQHQKARFSDAPKCPFLSIFFHYSAVLLEIESKLFSPKTLKIKLHCFSSLPLKVKWVKWRTETAFQP